MLLCRNDNFLASLYSVADWRLSYSTLMLQKRDELIKNATESKAPVIDCVSKVRLL